MARAYVDRPHNKTGGWEERAEERHRFHKLMAGSTAVPSPFAGAREEDNVRSFAAPQKRLLLPLETVGNEALSGTSAEVAIARLSIAQPAQAFGHEALSSVALELLR